MKRLWVLVLLVLVAASSASAVEVTFTPRLTLREEYTDNFYRTPDNEESEYITSIAPGATLGFIGTRGGLTLSYDPTYVSYAETDQESDWRHFASADGYWTFSRRTRLNFTNALTISEDPADIDVEAGVNQGRNRFTRYTGDVGITHQFGREDSAGVGYTYSLLEYENDLNEDSQERRPYADLTMWFGESRYGMEAHLDYLMTDYETSDDFTSLYGYLRLMRRMSRKLDLYLQYAHSITDYDGETVDYAIYNPSVGLAYRMGEDTNIDLAVGYLIRDYEEGEDDNAVSFTSDVDTIWQFPRGSFALTATSGYQPGSLTNEDLGFSYYGAADARLEYGFTRNWRGDLFGGYRYELFPDTEPEITDNTSNVGAGLSYQALSWMAFRLEYSFRTVSSTEDAREYDENRVFLSVTFEPANPFRLN